MTLDARIYWKYFCVLKILEASFKLLIELFAEDELIGVHKEDLYIFLPLYKLHVRTA